VHRDASRAGSAPVVNHPSIAGVAVIDRPFHAQNWNLF